MACEECESRDIEIGSLHDEVLELKEKVKDLDNESYELKQENTGYKDAIENIKQIIKYL